MSPTIRGVFEKLKEMAVFDLCLSANPSDRMLERARQKGENIPDKCKPGKLLENLTEEEREALRGLTSDMTSNERHWSK